MLHCIKYLLRSVKSDWAQSDLRNVRKLFSRLVGTCWASDMHFRDWLAVAQRAKVIFTTDWELRSVRKSFSQLIGSFAACGSHFHDGLGVSQRAKVIFTIDWRLRSVRKSFSRLIESFAACESHFYDWLGVAQRAEAIFATRWDLLSVRYAFSWLLEIFRRWNRAVYALEMVIGDFWTTDYLYVYVSKSQDLVTVPYICINIKQRNCGRITNP